MGHDLPALLHDLRVARHTAPAAQRATVCGLLAQAYEAAMDMLKQTGSVADATAAIERARWAAQRSDDPIRALTVEWHYSGEFIRVGELGDAADIIEGGLRELRPLAREDVTAAALAGAYELKASLVAARAGDPVTMWERWERARVIGEERAILTCRSASDPVVSVSTPAALAAASRGVVGGEGPVPVPSAAGVRVGTARFRRWPAQCGRRALAAVGLVQPHSRDRSTATSGNSSGEP